MPFHLLFPLAASVLLVFGTLFTNFSSRRGISTWTLIVVANFGGAICFSSFWLLGGTFPGWSSLWQPAIVAGLYVCGQILMLYSVSVGDVSVALPVASLKVVFVAALLASVTPEETLPLVSTGWLDTTRVAAGDIEMWRQILAHNRTSVLRCLEEFETVVTSFRLAMQQHDDAVVAEMLENGKQRRDALAD